MCYKIPIKLSQYANLAILKLKERDIYGQRCFRSKKNTSLSPEIIEFKGDFKIY